MVGKNIIDIFAHVNRGIWRFSKSRFEFSDRH
jgi:hypothetical protein